LAADLAQRPGLGDTQSAQVRWFGTLLDLLWIINFLSRLSVSDEYEFRCQIAAD
jgi:hypothetical protein